jgi:hypothetical protein
LWNGVYGVGVAQVSGLNIEVRMKAKGGEVPRRLPYTLFELRLETLQSGICAGNEPLDPTESGRWRRVKGRFDYLVKNGSDVAYRRLCLL